MLESKNQVPHRQTIKNKPSAKVHEMKIDFIDSMKSIQDYGEIQLQLTTDYKRLIELSECDEMKAYYVGKLLQMTLIVHEVAMLNDVY